MNATYDTDFLFAVEELQFRLSCAVNALDAIHCAMEKGDAPPEHYIDGLFCAYLYLFNLNEELEKYVDTCFEARKNDKEKK